MVVGCGERDSYKLLDAARYGDDAAAGALVEQKPKLAKSAQQWGESAFCLGLRPLPAPPKVWPSPPREHHESPVCFTPNKYSLATTGLCLNKGG